MTLTTAPEKMWSPASARGSTCEVMNLLVSFYTYLSIFMPSGQSLREGWLAGH